MELVNNNLKAIRGKYKKLSENYPNFRTTMSTVYVLIGLVIILSILSDKFFAWNNIINILTQGSVYLILGVGMTVVMATGGIDISVGSIIGLTSTVFGTFVMGYGVPWYIGIIIAILTGAILGAFNSLFVVKFKVPPIIVTLGTMTMFRGLAYAYQEGMVFYGFPKEILWAARGKILGIPAPIWISFLVFIAGYYFLNKTKTGRHLCALGGNREASRLSGINISGVLFLAYVVIGVCAGIATIILTARLDAAQTTAGLSMEMHSIAVVVIGGTTLTGGKANMIGTLLGVIILAVLENGLLLAGVGFYWQRVFLGLILIMVVAIRTYKTKRTV